MSISSEIVINAPLKNVVETFYEFDDYPNWSEFIDSIKKETVLEPGHRLAVTISINGKPNLFNPTILEKTPTKFVWSGELLSRYVFRGNHSFEFVDSGEIKTKVIQTEIFSGLIASLVLWQIGDATKKGFESYNESLKKKCEHGEINS
ncbi:Piso0_001223 [Millerozyma farinosa CBS 7064]|uniref:Piso0_001223 protein n=1 Tax=Pichia sorbitophila (strain ATCC MYA-4447 / BCRC 22081 / CBS 7064 / NBRC 10061 / NRRL Y-12695) TaxID=559304 RepID=G8YML2_PICSO|nr:Piso0_001223 [Millerozyma farinosa CBS 7064]